jgi:hypothetical protein
MMIDISIHFSENVPIVVVDDITVEKRQIHILRIYTLGDGSEIRLFFHDDQLFNEFIAQLKSQTWWR